jgi:prepilin-type N-terminal cleavage/methylation domain-containing protein
MLAASENPRGRVGAKRRQGFTLVEMLVALALTLFIMSILSEAFFAGTKVFRDFKAIGDMTRRLRTASRLLLNDLAAPHCLDSGNATNPSNIRYLNDVNFWSTTPTPKGPPAEGFFRFGQSGADGNEGSDLSGVPSYTNAGQSWLHFTVVGQGQSPQAFYRSYPPTGSLLLNDSSYALLPTIVNQNGDSRYQDYASGGTGAATYTTFNSPWAEVAWFMQPATQAPTNINGVTSLFTLYRRQRVAWPLGSSPSPPSITTTTDSTPDDVSCETDNATPTAHYHFNTPNDLTMPPLRFGMLSYTGATTAGLPTGPPLPVAPTDAAYSGQFLNPLTGSTGYPAFPSGYSKFSEDIVLTDVISFDVRVLIPGATDFTDLFTTTPTPSTIPNLASYATYLNAGKYYPQNPAYLFVPAAGSATLSGLTTPTGTLVFDTWSQGIGGTGMTYYNYTVWNETTAGTGTGSYAYAPLQVPILAIKVSIRIWDSKSETARQVSIIQSFAPPPS